MPNQRHHTWLDKFRVATRGRCWPCARKRALPFSSRLPRPSWRAAWLQMSLVEWCVLVLSITIVLAAEAFNTALEHLAKAVTQEEDHRSAKCSTRRRRRPARRHRRRNRRRRPVHQPPLVQRNLVGYRPPNRGLSHRVGDCPSFYAVRGATRGLSPPAQCRASTPTRAPRRSPSARAQRPTPAPAPSIRPARLPRSARPARRPPASPPPGSRRSARRQSLPRPAGMQRRVTVVHFNCCPSERLPAAPVSMPRSCRAARKPSGKSAE